MAFVYSCFMCICVLGGKSAVLTALIVALGGKAHATNRGSSLKGFVKEGERYDTYPDFSACSRSLFIVSHTVFVSDSSADVSITLKNRGRDAYKPEVFGLSIIVDLRISSEGIRTYKLRNKTGILINTELFHLWVLTHFG